MKEHGFTLIETLIVLAIGALLLAGISNAIASFAPALERVKNNTEKSQLDIRLISLANILKSARFVDIDQQAFTQKPNTLTFMSHAPMASGRRGYVIHQLQIVDKNDEGVMQLNISDAEANFPSVNILQGVDKVVFPKQIDLVARNQSHNIVHKVIINLSNGEQRSIPINPIVTETKTCIFDPISQVCRE